jgi:prepilin-type N-terminal cleavage/methylation domain-containing protein
MKSFHRSSCAPRGPKGFTLVELLVTVGLFIIIMTIAVGGFVNAIRTQGEVSSLIAAQSNVALTIEEMARTIRTGYLFCHQQNNTSPLAACGCSPIYGAGPNTWSCSELDFYDAGGDHVQYYKTSSGALVQSTNGVIQPIAGNTVTTKHLSFQLFGQLEGDSWPPRVTISIGIAPNSTDPAIANDVFTLQTTVSARSIDCSISGSKATC